MKRIFLFCLAAAMLATGLSSCGSRHHWLETWLVDSTHHWHSCADEGCTEKKDLEEHLWNNGRVITAPTPGHTGKTEYACTVCGCTRQETTVYVPPKTTVNESEWKAMFNPVNVTVSVNGHVCRITERQVRLGRLEADGREEVEYLLWNGNHWRRVICTEQGYEAKGSEQIEYMLAFISRDFNYVEAYADFRYDSEKQAYVNASGVEIYVQNGQIVKLNTGKQLGGVDLIGVFYNYGTTVGDALPEELYQRDK